MKKNARKTVIVGALTDWPLGTRLAKILHLPDSVTALGCFQAVGPHGEDAAALVRNAQEDRSKEAKAAATQMQAALDLCSPDKATTGFHGSCSPDEVRALLSTAYDVLTPTEAAAERRKTPAQSLKAIEKALQNVDGLPRKRLLTWLGKGGPFIDVDAEQLGKVFVAHPESLNEVDERLLSLWCHTVTAVTRFFPMPPAAPEQGFDRRGLYVDRLCAAGVSREVVEGMMLTRWAEFVRWYPSTGIWVWEQIVTDPKGFSRRVLETDDGALNLAKVLSSMLELRRSVLDAGALSDLQRFCADAALVPDETMAKLMKDEAYRALLGSVKRHGTSASFRPFPNGKIERGVPLRELG